MYCITCEKNVEKYQILTNNDYFTHAIPYDDIPYLTWDCCDGILVGCPPPELPDDWIEHVQEPEESVCYE
jgi:hypothetical protein